MCATSHACNIHNLRLNESPYEKVGKFITAMVIRAQNLGLNESPYEKVGKSHMNSLAILEPMCLNESPYEKVGKFGWLIESNAHFVKPQ